MAGTTNPEGSGSLSLMEAMKALETEETPQVEQVEEASAELEEEENPNQESESEVESEDEIEEEEGSLTEEEAEETKEPEQFVVKVDGEEVKVTFDELKAGYSRLRDYTKKSQALAEQRKALEAESQAVLAERQQYQQILSELQKQLTVENEPDWDELRNTDPIEYGIQMADWNRKQMKLAAVQNEQQRILSLQQAEQEKSLKVKLQQETQALINALPDWQDSEKQKAIIAKVSEQGKKLGFKDEELEQLFDHRALVALHKAALYDELMSKRQSLKPAVANSKTISPKTAAPVVNTVVKRAKQAFASKPSVASAAQLLTLLEK